MFGPQQSSPMMTYGKSAKCWLLIYHQVFIMREEVACAYKIMSIHNG